jgi:hypothetical protein
MLNRRNYLLMSLLSCIYDSSYSTNNINNYETQEVPKPQKVPKTQNVADSTNKRVDRYQQITQNSKDIKFVPGISDTEFTGVNTGKKTNNEHASKLSHKTVSENSNLSLENTPDKCSINKKDTYVIICPNAEELMTPQHFIKINKNASDQELIVIYTWSTYQPTLYEYLVHTGKKLELLVRNFRIDKTFIKQSQIKETTHYKSKDRDVMYQRSDEVDVLKYSFDEEFEKKIKSNIIGITLDNIESGMLIKALAESCSRIIKDQSNFREDKQICREEITIVTYEYAKTIDHFKKTAKATPNGMIRESPDCHFSNSYEIYLGDLYYTTKKVEGNKKNETIEVGEITSEKYRNSTHQHVPQKLIKIKMYIVSPNQLLI